MIEAKSKHEHGSQHAGEDDASVEAESDMTVIGVASEFEPLPCGSDSTVNDRSRKHERSQQSPDGENV